MLEHQAPRAGSSRSVFAAMAMTMVPELSPTSSSAKQHEVVCGSSNRPAKLFIGGITRNTTTKQLRDHFSAYGRVLDCVAMRQPDGRPRGFGYVTLDSSAAADRCLAVPQVVDGRVVDLKLAVPEGDVSDMPAIRLHTPGTKQTQQHMPNTSFGSWAEISAYGFPMSPLSTMSPMGNIGSVMGDAACRWPWGMEDFSQAVGVPDCLDLLSRGRTGSGLLSTSPHAAGFPWSLPATPTAGPATALSASAPEFVPFESKKNKATKRAVLSDVTNSVGREGNEAPGLAKKTILGTRPAAPASKENIENAENIPPSANRSLKPASQTRSLGIRENKAMHICVDDEFETPVQEVELAAENKESEACVMPESKETENMEIEKEAVAAKEIETSKEEAAVAPSSVEDDSLPSLGSAEHAAGTCKRCNFFPKGRCQNGKNCTFCHLPHEKRKPSRQEKRERRAAWLAQQEAGHVGEMPEEFQDDEDDEDDDSDDVAQVMAYPVLPGLPPLRATKLPAPLTLPGTGYSMISMSGYSCYPPLPPPGLCLAPMGLEAWQADDEVNNLRRSVPSPLLMTAPPLLATVPMTPCTPQSVAASPTSAVVKVMFLAASSPAAASVGHLRATYGMEVTTPLAAVAPKPAMVTMATQTEEEDSAEEVATETTAREDAATTRPNPCTWSKTELLKFRPSVKAQTGSEGASPLKAMVVNKAEAN